MPSYGSSRKKTPRRFTHRGFDRHTCREDGIFFDADHMRKHKQTEKKKAYELRKTPKWKSRVQKEGRCAYCSIPLTVATATMDHIVPLSRGGKTTMSNIVVSCQSCNTQKSSQIAVEWLVFDQQRDETS